MRIFTVNNEFILKGGLVEEAAKYGNACFQVGGSIKTVHINVRGAQSGVLLKKGELIQKRKNRYVINANEHCNTSSAIVILRADVGGQFLSPGGSDFPCKILARGLIGSGDIVSSQLIVQVYKNEKFLVRYTETEEDCLVVTDYVYHYDGTELTVNTSVYIH